MRLCRRTAAAGVVLTVAALTAPLGPAGGGLRSSAGTCDPATPARPEVVSVDVTPRQRPVGVFDLKPITFTVTFRDDCHAVFGVDFASGRLTDGVLEDGSHPISEVSLPWDRSQPDAHGLYHATETLQLDPRRLTTEDAGAWTTSAALRGQDEEGLDHADGPNWYLQRWSRLSNDATEPARKGTKIKLTGRLSRANWDDGAYHDAPRQFVDRQQRTSTGRYGDVYSGGYTDEHGLVTVEVTATTSSCFRYVFGGTSTTMPVKGVGDCVEVS